MGSLKARIAVTIAGGGLPPALILGTTPLERAIGGLAVVTAALALLRWGPVDPLESDIDYERESDPSDLERSSAEGPYNSNYPYVDIVRRRNRTIYLIGGTLVLAFAVIGYGPW